MDDEDGGLAEEAVGAREDGADVLPPWVDAPDDDEDDDDEDDDPSPVPEELEPHRAQAARLARAKAARTWWRRNGGMWMTPTQRAPL